MVIIFINVGQREGSGNDKNVSNFAFSYFFKYFLLIHIRVLSTNRLLKLHFITVCTNKYDKNIFYVTWCNHCCKLVVFVDSVAFDLIKSFNVSI
jgi:hypothetical protein